MKGSLMTTNNKFMLSMATIAILSGASVALGAESELKVEGTELKLGADKVTITNGVANVAPKDADKTDDIAIKSKLDSKIGTDTMTQLNITAKEAAVNVGTTSQSAAVSIGGTAPANGAVSADGYGVNIDAKSVALAGAASKETQLNVNANSTITTTDGATLGANSAINIANGTNLNVNGGLTATGGAINVGGGALTTDSLIVNNTSKITFGENGVLTINKNLSGDKDESVKWKDNDFVKGAKGSNFDFTKGGTLVLAAPKDESEKNGLSITGAGDTNALKLGKGTITLVNSSVLADIEELKADKGSGKINLNGGSLATTKVTADASHFDFSKGGTLAFGTHLVAMDSKKEQNTAQTSTTGSKITGTTTLNSNTMVGFLDGAWVHFEELKTNGADVRFANGTLNVKNLTANASDLHFNSDTDPQAAKGGTIELATGGKHDISGHLTLDDKQSYKFSAAGTLNLESLSLTKTGNITFAGKDSVLNLANGMTSDDAKTQIVLTNGGTINFNGGNSLIKGKDSATNVFTTTTGKDTLFNVKGGALNLENVKLDSAKSILTIDGGVVNAAGLTTTDAKNLALKQGTLNFVGKANDKGEIETLTSTIGADLDLSKAGAQVNFNKGSLVKFTGTNGLTANDIYLNGGEINLKKLVAATSNADSTARLNFSGAQAIVSGELKNDKEFSVGTDDKGNHFITKATETAKVGANSTLTLNSGIMSANGTLQTESGGKLLFGGGLLNVGESGKLEIAKDTLEFKDGVGGTLTLKGKSDGTGGGVMNIADGDLDLSNTMMNITVEQGASLSLNNGGTAKIIGKGNAINLSDYASLTINGGVSGVKKVGGTALADAYKIDGDLTLTKGTTLGVSTRTDKGGVLKEISVGKLTATDGANLAFGNGGVVKLTGATKDSEALKLNNVGFADKLTLAKDSTLEFASGSVNVKGLLDAAEAATSGKFNTLKVSNSTANLNGGLGANMTKIELSNGALNVKGDYTGTGIDVTHIQTNASGIGSAMNIDGTANITSSKFAILPLVETGATSYKVLSTTKGLTVSDLNGATTAEFRTRNSLNGILSKYGLELQGDKTEIDKVTAADKVITAKDSSVTATLKADDKNLFLERKVDVSSLAAVKQASLQADIDALGEMNNKANGVVSDTSAAITTAINNLTARKTAAASQSNTELASELGGANSDILLSAFGKKVGAINELTRNAVTLDIVKNGGQGIVADIKEGASSAANMSSSTSSVINTMNLSNDMAISGRIAQANNPYGNLAQGFAGYEYANVEGDLPLYYANNGYKNGFWANAIGGLNKVEGEGGTLVGLSLGFDRQLENTLVGFYLSYAMAGLNDKIVEQGADNIQVGVYTSFNQRDIEVNVKAYGQVAVTETTAKRGEGEAEAKFTRLYGGVSANVGFIFALNNNKTFIKPYVGENYYYAHTPAYEESLQSDAALSVKSANNHALSFDVGVDLRQYFTENSFMYLTPSLERYVVNAGGDYTAGFIGSDTTFTIEGKSKTKTYGQVLVGGNIALSDKLNVNLGLGVKKILNGQIERANGDKVDEMYLSGNLGVKYRF